MFLENEIIDYEENISNIQKWFLLKGEYRYQRIINILKDNNITCLWSNVTDAMRFDRRINHIVFKYYIFLEDIFRAELYRKKLFDPDKEERFDGFRGIINKYLDLKDRSEIEGMNYNILKDFKEPIIQLRNGIMHNSILLGVLYSGKELDDVIRAIYDVLPSDYKDGFKSDINKSLDKLSADLCIIAIKI